RSLSPVHRRRPRRPRGLRPRVEHEHHRGLDRGVPRRRQQAPRRNKRRGVGVRRRAHGGALLTRYRIGAIPGDGVGPEVIASARSVVDAVGAREGFDVDWLEVIAGGAGIDAYGLAIREEDLAAVGACDAILLGAVGGPRWDDPDAMVRPEQALFALRG